MANSENLKPIQSTEEAREKGKKGGKKSGEVRRARKTLKEELLVLLSDNDSQKKISIALLKKAIKGNIKAFEVIRDTIGEKPVDKQLTAQTTPEQLNIVVDEKGIQEALERTRKLAEDE
jgi:hypothetical protein|nr:MAG TPA: hypothetical protein [Caudoviricetes sp.]